MRPWATENGPWRAPLVLFAGKAKTKAVNLRVRLIWPFFGLLWLSIALPAAGSSSAQASPQLLPPLQRFRFDSGAPLAAAAGVAPDGSVCVGTVDGYVHGLSADGGFQFSRSVHGAVTRRPLFIGERWFVATSAQRVYALNRDGSLYWAFPLSSPVNSELAADAGGTLYFVAADHFLYGLTGHGAVSLRTRFRAGMKPELAFQEPEALRDPQGNVWRGRSDGALEFRGASGEKTSLLPLTSSPLLLPAWSKASRLVVVSARSGLVFGLDPSHIRTSP